MCKCVCVCVFKLPNCRLQPVKMNVVFNPLAGYRVRSVTQCLGEGWTQGLNPGGERGPRHSEVSRRGADQPNPLLGDCSLLWGENCT